MGLNPKYSKAILNAMFHTSGVSGVDPAVEKAELLAQGVPDGGATAELYFAAFRENGNKEGSDTANAYDEARKLVNASSCWEAVSETKTFTYEVSSLSGGQYVTTEKTVSITGWVMKRAAAQKVLWPQSAYLALFTKMPNEKGLDYVEPVVDAEGNATTYIRVNLHEAIISGGVCISRAIADTEGGSRIENTEIFVFPEVFGPLWGDIVGFGIMSSETPGGNDAANHWARLTTPLTTQNERIPLFRLGGFKSTLR